MAARTSQRGSSTSPLQGDLFAPKRPAESDTQGPSVTGATPPEADAGSMDSDSSQNGLPRGPLVQASLFGSLPPAQTARPKHSSREREPRVPLPDFSHLPPLPDGVAFGTSSWTYPGWKGRVYSRTYREGDAQPMLQEYVRCPLFSCVGLDSTFYRPPSVATLKAYAEILPDGFAALGKVYDRLTIRRFSRDVKWGAQAGQLNPDFLNPQRCVDEVVGPWLEHLRSKAGPLMFEFQALEPGDRPQPGEWGERLHRFFSALPPEGQYSVELRNPELLGDVHLEALRSAGVAHVYNSWTRMPGIGVQRNRVRQVLGGSSFTGSFGVVRALLRPGRTYEQAVDSFQPYDHVQEVQQEVRDDVLQIISDGLREHVRVYVLVNNRLEGHSPGTIEAIRMALAQRMGKAG